MIEFSSNIDFDECGDGPTIVPVPGLLSIPGAAHFMIATHPEDVAQLLKGHIIVANDSLSKASATPV